MDTTTHPELWARLLAGEVTEVLVLGALRAALPQTLGLEVIDYQAYEYDTRGVARAPWERAEVARQLASEDRWLVTVGPRYWVEPFAERAGAILILPGATGHDEATAELVTDLGLDHVARAVGKLLRRRRRGAADETPETSMGPMVVGDHGDGSVTSAQISSDYRMPRNYVRGEFPAKTFLVSRKDLSLLRSVRARPRG